MKLALCIQTPEVEKILPVALLSGEFKDKLKRARQLGADGVELMTTDPRRLDWNGVREQIVALGLQAAAISSGGMAFSAGLTLLDPDDQIADTAKLRLMDLIDFAAALGAPVVTIGSFRGRPPERDGRSRQRLLALLAETASYAGALKVKLALEPLNRYETDLIRTVDDGLALVQKSGQSALGLLLDTYHVNIEESSWKEPFRRALQAGRLYHVHLADNNRLAPGQGLIDFAAILRVLKAGGYNGYLSAELLPLPDPDEAARLTLEHMRRLLELVGTEIG